MSNLQKKFQEYEQAIEEGKKFFAQVQSEAEEIEQQLEAEQHSYNEKIKAYDDKGATESKRKIRDLEDELEVKREILSRDERNNNPKLVSVLDEILKEFDKEKEKTSDKGQKVIKKLEEHQKQTVALMNELIDINKDFVTHKNKIRDLLDKHGANEWAGKEGTRNYHELVPNHLRKTLSKQGVRVHLFNPLDYTVKSKDLKS